jgi:hypothetical protein
MKMSREFGTLSYKPEDVNFYVTYSKPSTDGFPNSNINSEPFVTINRLISKNLLLAAYLSPSTAEQLALELGIPLPYTQDELNHLKNLRLMKKTGDKYETAFFIISAAAQYRMYAFAQSIAPALTEKIIEIINTQDKLETPLSKAWNSSLQSPVDARLARILTTYDWTISKRIENEIFGHALRQNKKDWEITGMEQAKNDLPSVGQGKLGNMKYFRHYRICYDDIDRKTAQFVTLSQDEALYSITEDKTDNISKEDMDFLIENGYVNEQNGRYTVTFPVIPKEMENNPNEQNPPEIEKLLNSASEIAKTFAVYGEKEINNDAPDFLKDKKSGIDFAFGICDNYMRIAIFDEALKNDFIKNEASVDHRMIGAFLIK